MDNQPDWDLVVSVPLRGLSSWKGHPIGHHFNKQFSVSVPLRGLSSWKASPTPSESPTPESCFSPLAGIKFVESNLPRQDYETQQGLVFQSPCGD